MPVITRQIGPCFAAEVEGVDLTRPLSHEDVAAIHAGMDRYAVLVLHDLSSHAGAILGWPVPEARAFLRDLVEHATQRQFVYAHTWRVGDLVMWDNRQTMHRGRPFPAHEPRDVRRTTLAGDGPTVAQAV